jgi:transcription elongation factor GreB
MSKAFTKEEDAGLLDETPEADEDEEVSRAPRYITRPGFRALQEELERIWKVERPRVTAEVSAAAAQGDRSENAEYIYGKKKLRELDRRIRFLSKRLDTLTIVEERIGPAEKVFFGVTVTVEDEEGIRSTYRIVGPDEADARAGLVSVDSPLAKALLGKRPGDEALVVRPRGEVLLVITDVRFGPA